MLTTVTKVSQAAGTPVSLTDIKAHLNISGNQDDARLNDLLLDAAEVLEKETQISLSRTGWLEKYDCFPRFEIQTCKSPVLAIASLAYYQATDNTLQTLVSGTDYYFTLPTYQPAFIYPQYRTWFQTYPRPDAVQLTYVAGPVVSRIANNAIKQLCGFWNEGRGDSGSGSDFPEGIDRLFRLLRNAQYN